MIRSSRGLVTILWFVAAACICSAGIRSAAAQTPSPADVQRWIVELGDDNYMVRKAAADRLAAGGSAARAALAQVADGPDPEIRSAARRLVTLIDDTEFNRRLAEFAADVDGRRGVMLPGWKEFGELIGRDPAARALFVDMQREDAAVLERAFDASAGSRTIAWEEQLSRLTRTRRFNLGQFAAPLGRCATLVFLGAQPDANLSDEGAMRLGQLILLPPVNEVLTAKRPENAMRRLVCAWIVHCPNRSEPVLTQRLSIMLQQQLAEALPLALEMIERNPKYLTLSPSLQVTAILAVGKFGSEENVADLEPLLDDRSEYLPGAQSNGFCSVQIRDVALAALLHLTGQEPLTYGLLHARAHPQTVFDVTSLHMENDERRAAAVEQWRAWRAQHKLDGPRPASS